MVKNMKIVSVAVLFSIALMATCVCSVRALLFIEDYASGQGLYSSCWAYVSGWWDIDKQMVYSVYHNSGWEYPDEPGWGHWGEEYPSNGGSAHYAYTYIFVGYLSGGIIYVDSEAWAQIPYGP